MPFCCLSALYSFSSHQQIQDAQSWNSAMNNMCGFTACKLVIVVSQLSDPSESATNLIWLDEVGSCAGLPGSHTIWRVTIKNSLLLGLDSKVMHLEEPNWEDSWWLSSQPCFLLRGGISWDVSISHDNPSAQSKGQWEIPWGHPAVGHRMLRAVSYPCCYPAAWDQWSVWHFLHMQNWI